jgi:nucleoid DNA-binding protein
MASTLVAWKGFLDNPRISPPAQEIAVVTKKEIVKTISDEIGLTQLKTKEIVQKTFDAIVDTLVADTRLNLSKGGDGPLGRIELRNFGVFEVKRRAARKARNPRTGEKVFVGEKFVVTFKPGKEMEERVRNLERADSADDAPRQLGESPPATDARGDSTIRTPPSYGAN